MKTVCHCIYCPKHPLHKQRAKIGAPIGFVVGETLDSAAGRKVDCLDPMSNAFNEFSIDPQFEEFPTTAYGDGIGITGFARDGVVLTAVCGNEGYKQ